MKIDVELLLLLSELYSSIPLRTPDRYVLIHQLATEIWSNRQKETRCKTEVVIDTTDEEYYSSKTNFCLTMENVIRYKQDFPAATCSLQFDANYPKILIPIIYFCCNKPLKIVPYYASLILYTNCGSRIARSYHTKCQKCKTKYYRGFSESSNGQRTFESIDDIDTLIFTSGVAFSTDLLKSFDKMICIGAMTFEKLAEYYNSLHLVEINPDRIETSWFIYRIIQHVRVFEMWPRKNSKEMDVEALCKHVYGTIKNEMRISSLDHVCDDVGCAEKFVVINGNEKLFRSICAADKERLEKSPGDVNRIKVCIENPMRGNQYREVSNYCAHHQHDCTLPVEEPLDIRPITRSMTSNIPSVVTSGAGCKSDDAVDRFYSRTAGMFYIFRPCGYRLAAYEMYTAESLSSVFTFLVDLFGDDPSQHLRGIAYDRTCGFHPFLRNLGENGNEIAERYASLHFLVDIFHVNKHTTDTCTIGHPNCIYHPYLPRFEFVRKMNTEIAEQSFSRINPFKNSSRKMTYCRRLLYLMFIDEHENKRRFR